VSARRFCQFTLGTRVVVIVYQHALDDALFRADVVVQYPHEWSPLTRAVYRTTWQKRETRDEPQGVAVYKQACDWIARTLLAEGADYDATD
jgi:hypothetical protein